jgi:tRNA (cmo5U34)-methyltransferase
MSQSDNTTPHLASYYDEQVQATIPYYDTFHSETISLVKTVNPQPKLWLDTGCGTGTLVGKALEYFETTTFILADPSSEMLVKARDRVPEANRIRFLEPTATQDLYLSERFDVITAIQAHHYLSREMRQKATQVCFNLLKEGGIYITFENIRPLTVQGIQIGLNHWGQFQLSQGKNIDAVSQHRQRFDREYFPITVLEHLDLLKTCGFKTGELFWFSSMQAGFFGIK